mmetsp:Transcript_1019/g.2467  ORF Transcript_1019/g.2467 Transcript_1019/m.2467 type:complete len:146 (+) Transcript_1019:399-836(+)
MHARHRRKQRQQIIKSKDMFVAKYVVTREAFVRVVWDKKLLFALLCFALLCFALPRKNEIANAAAATKPSKRLSAVSSVAGAAPLWREGEKAKNAKHIQDHLFCREVRHLCMQNHGALEGMDVCMYACIVGAELVQCKAVRGAVI